MQKMLGCKETRVRYKLTLATGLLECLCFAGIVFGWASLMFVLKSEGYFSDMCVNVTNTSGENSDCSPQDENFSLVFTVASFMNNFLTLPNGFFYDHFGTMATRLLAIILYTTGTLLVALSNEALSLLLFPALSFIAAGGILFLMTNMQVLYERGVSLRSSFFFLSACNVIHLLRTVFLMPKSHIPYPVPENYTYGLSCAKSNNYNVEEYEAEREQSLDKGGCEDDEPLETADSPDNSEKVSLKSCVLSWFFLWHLVWLSVMQLRHYFFIGTLNPMLNRLADQDPVTVSQYTNAFAFTQLCGVLCAPWNGLLMDRHRRRPLAPGLSEREADLRSSILSLLLTSLQCLLFSIFASVPLLPIQYLTFILQVLNRSFLYGGNAAFISIAFPAHHFGKLYGLVMSLSAMVSLLQYPCFALSTVLGDPFYVNIILTVLTLLAFIHPLNVFLRCRELTKQRENLKSMSESSITETSMY
ncbi:solute carrier family 43 member 3a isoform X2 [Triplophysa rosa]|uniref:solute carrier family 43 member 3a isoform X2 n=1 Tax=Triplophysa rosa TaxID=992332 RepID=UPI002545F5DB|nr:solute carrier family 43 member 3a isoform X2 [Triplophysa rosa]